MGVTSYLLINHYFTRDAASRAAFSAIALNRVGDASLIICFVVLGSQGLPLDIEALSLMLDDGNVHPSAPVLLAVAAIAKSAQIGLHSWLPTAMEGPTPVSALLHAATMVCAGVILLVRMTPIMLATPLVSTFLVFTAGITLGAAALTALRQPDLKRIVAYSTLSQLGYMALGSAFLFPEAAMLHLWAHSFFKALLFVGAGLAIHALGEDQDQRHAGGLYLPVPVTAVAGCIGVLALVGFPFLAA